MTERMTESWGDSGVICEEVSVDNLRNKLRPEYSVDEIQDIKNMLNAGHAFELKPFESGLIPAAGGGEGLSTGYENSWLRDQMIVAIVELKCGDPEIATGIINGSMQQSLSQRHRFSNMIQNPNDKWGQWDDNKRPHIRWNGREQKEVDPGWSHAQNDALGFFLCAYTEAIAQEQIEPTDNEIAQLGYIARYLEAIEYWNDEESGHWEESRKIQASSIGIAAKGLTQLKQYMQSSGKEHIFVPEHNGDITVDRLDNMIRKGWESMGEILPRESIQDGRYRESDSALLSLLWMDAIDDDDVANDVIHNVVTNLMGDHGIKRYQQDYYFGCQWDNHVAAEAEWCLFDSMLSSIFSRRYQRTNDKLDLDVATEFLNRALTQVTTHPKNPQKLAVPEMYYVDQSSYNGNPAEAKYQVNENTPLLWSASNLRMALHDMENSLKEESQNNSIFFS